MLSEGEEWLGFKDIRKFNDALLAKWKWRLMSEEKGRWKEVLMSKYGIQSDHNIQQLNLKSWWWRDLSKTCSEGNGWFRNATGWRVGAGDTVSFWNDVWVGNKILKDAFLRLFTISLDQRKNVGEVGVWLGSK